MGSCMSNGGRIDDKEELNASENKLTKIETAQLKRVSNMSQQEKSDFLQSSELPDYLRLCGSTNTSALSDVVKEIAPKENQALVKNIQSVVARILMQKDKSPPVSNPNHSQFVSIQNTFSMNLERPLGEYLRGQSHTRSVLDESFLTVVKVLLVQQTLFDPEVKPDEKWWGTGDNHSQLFQEIAHCKSSIESAQKEAASNNFTDLFANTTTNKSDVLSQVLSSYLPKLYLQSVDAAVAKRS